MPHPILSTHVGNHKQKIPARPSSQCNQSSPTSVIFRNIGHLQNTLKSKFLSYWLFLFAIASNTQRNNQNAGTFDMNSSSPLSYANYSTIAKTSRVSLLLSLRTSIRKMILLVKYTINHEYALLYFPINRKTTAKTKDTPKLNTISATINTIHQRYTSQQYGAPTHSFLQIVIVCISAPPISFWSDLRQKNTASFGFTKTV